MKTVLVFVILVSATRAFSVKRATTTTTTTNTTTSANSTCAPPGFCNSNVGCGEIYNFTSPAIPNFVQPVYVFSGSEVSGACCRQNLSYAGTNISVEVPNPLGHCNCKNATCEACIQGKMPANATCCGGRMETFTFGSISLQYYIPYKPSNGSCCMASGLSPDRQPLHVCHCEPTATECFPNVTMNNNTMSNNTNTTTPTNTTYCPVYPPPATTSRVFGGVQVQDCGSSVVSIIGEMEGQNTTSCNGVYTYYPSANLTQPVVLLPRDCFLPINTLAGFLQFVSVSVQIRFFFKVENTSFAFSTSDFTRTNVGNFLVALQFNSSLLSQASCLKPACAYNPATMSSVINKTDCYVLSRGAVSGTDFSTQGLYRLNVVYNTTGCVDVQNQPAECFASASPGGGACIGDYGSPVQCSLTSGETVVYGGMGDWPGCVNGSSVIPVVPLP